MQRAVNEEMDTSPLPSCTTLDRMKAHNRKVLPRALNGPSQRTTCHDGFEGPTSVFSVRRNVQVLGLHIRIESVSLNIRQQTLQCRPCPSTKQPETVAAERRQRLANPLGQKKGGTKANREANLAQPLAQRKSQTRQGKSKPKASEPAHST